MTGSNGSNRRLTSSARSLRALAPSLNDRLEEIFSSPTWYPAELDLVRNRMSFIRLSREDYAKETFLDIRQLREYETCKVNIDDLLLYSCRASEKPAPIQYILHGAFCCSTLLARYLDLLPQRFALREPGILATIAGLSSPHTPVRARLDKMYGSGTAARWEELFVLCRRLLGRTYGDNDIVVIKVNDLCNAFGHVLLGCDPGSKAVFLSTSLRTFLLSTLKTEKRRDWVEQRVKRTILHPISFPALAAIDVDALTAAERSAYLWLFNQMLCHNLLRRWGRERVLPLNGDIVAEAPSEALKSVTDFWGWHVEEDQMTRALADPMASNYSKFKGEAHAYDAAARRRDLARWEELFGEEVEQGVAWATAVTGSTKTLIVSGNSWRLEVDKGAFLQRRRNSFRWSSSLGDQPIRQANRKIVQMTLSRGTVSFGRKPVHPSQFLYRTWIGHEIL
jgi:hypothetical protein